MNLNYCAFSNEQFQTPRLTVENALETPNNWPQVSPPQWFAVMYAPDEFGPTGFRLSELTLEQKNRFTDRVHALYALYRSQFNDAVFEYARAFRNSEKLLATGELKPTSGESTQ